MKIKNIFLFVFLFSGIVSCFTPLHAMQLDSPILYVNAHFDTDVTTYSVYVTNPSGKLVCSKDHRTGTIKCSFKTGNDFEETKDLAEVECENCRKKHFLDIPKYYALLEKYYTAQQKKEKEEEERKVEYSRGRSHSCPF